MSDAKENSTASPAVVTDPLSMGAGAIRSDFNHYFSRAYGQHTLEGAELFAYKALVNAVRDRIMERWARTRDYQATHNTRRTAYLSLEFLMGRLLSNALLNIELEAPVREALETLGIELETLAEQEHDAGLGNGGLGRLAACFLDSCATLALPVTGYGIRYRYGMFHQQFENGRQIEEPDQWLKDGFGWEIRRRELCRTVRFGGRSEAYRTTAGHLAFRWVDTDDVVAVPYDVPIPGYKNDVINTLRLWSAEATDDFDLGHFNAGSYADAVAQKNAAENITMVLYPNANSENGQILRLRQQYFLASASLQDTLQDWRSRHGDDFSAFAEKNCFQLNDTHPAIAVAELMRLLMDEEGLGWENAWEITSSTMAYTNHTLLPEALELWPVSMFKELLPRLLDIIFEINARFLAEVASRWPGDTDRLRRMSLVAEDGEPMLRMAYLAIVGSYSVNGVAELHSTLLKSGLFSDFYELWPDKFNNKTNGVTQRRWLAACNPTLSDLITNKIGDEWITDLPKLEQLAPLADDEGFRKAWHAAKQHNKALLARMIRRDAGIRLPIDMMFDVQVKRIHEYKRQLLNIMHAIHRYVRICAGDTDGMVPRAIIIGGKAAPGYVMAKNIIKLINNVAKVINADPRTQDLLRIVFYPDYNVSAMERICPAADLSEQVSTAGKEASGTGNMKFMMNGALTIGTLDGANVEIREAVGEAHFFLFGLTVDEIRRERARYNPSAIIAADSALSQVMHLLESGHFNQYEPGIFDDILAALRSPDDPWMTIADFSSYVAAQEEVDATYAEPELWTRKSILNVAASGRFSTDRTMRDYNDDIWRLTPMKTSS
ncbi:MAG: glycogen/starch/alpha-glucan phosphorylase [Pseudomonadota bacterium]